MQTEANKKPRICCQVRGFEVFRYFISLTNASARTSGNNKDEYEDERYDIETSINRQADDRKNPDVFCFGGECLRGHGLRLNAE